jgi:hypothetical protein
MMIRWRRQPVRDVREILKPSMERDRQLVMFGHWRYQRSWPDRPDWNDFKFEDFQRAFELFESELEGEDVQTASN